MKMRKLVSMLSAFSIVASCCALLPSISFAAEKPTMYVESEKITDFSGHPADVNLSDMGYDTYMLTFKGTGLDLSTTVGGGMSKPITGNSIIGATIKVETSSDGVYDSDWMLVDGDSFMPATLKTWNPEHTAYTYSMVGTDPIYPPAKTEMTVTKDEFTDDFYHLYVVLDPSKPVTFKLVNCAIDVGEYTNGQLGTTTTYTQDDGSIDVNVETVTVPTPAEPEATIDSITIDPTEVTVNGGKTQTFSVVVEGTGDYDNTYTLSATAGTFDGDVFTAPEATEEEQVITITATANGDNSKTATATVTVPAKEEPPVTGEATKVEFGEEGKAIFFDSEAKTYTLGVDAYINITSAEDGVTKKFGHQYFLNKGIEGGGAITATFGVVADAKYADGNFSFDIINNN